MPRLGLGHLYARVAGDRLVKGLAGFRGRRLVKARALLPRRLQPTLRLVGHGVRLRVTSDPLDVRIVRAVTSVDREVFFPLEVGDPANVRLVLDLGAHHGVYTAVAAHEYPSARIIAVEPALDSLLALRAQIAENGIGDRVEVVPAALADRAGLATLSHEGSGSWGATIHEPDVAVASETVAALTLAQIVGDRAVDVVKSNAEGAEYELVEQLGSLPRLPPTMVLAVHHEYGDVPGLRTSLESLGYLVEERRGGHHPIWVASSRRPPDPGRGD